MQRTLMRSVTLAVLVFMAFLALVAWYGITSIISIYEPVDYLTSQAVERLELSARFSARLMRAATEAETVANGGGAENLEEAEEALEQAIQDLATLEALRQREQARSFGLARQDERVELQQRQVAMLDAVSVMVVTVASGDAAAIAEVVERQEEFEEELAELDLDTHNLVTQDTAAASTQVRQAIQYGITSVAISFGLVSLLILFAQLLLRRQVIRPINTLASAANIVADGRFDQTVPVTSRDEIGALQQAFNTMVRNLRDQHVALEARTSELKLTLAAAQRARSEAEQANQLKSQFLANMSHELRTPLNAIINFTRILSAGMRGPVNEQQRDYLERVHQSGEHLLRMINDILDLSKIEAGRMELHYEQLQIGEVLGSALETAAVLVKEKPVTLQQELMPDLPPVRVDRTRIRQVLLNLLSNAAKFTEEGSITIRAVRQGDELIISVADTGIGIASENLKAIFEEFRQVEGESNRRYEGTGLGLAICRSLVSLHGGRIWVESSPGTGSTFSFSLPIDPAPAIAEPALTTPFAALSEQAGIPVLVIDDNSSAIEIVASYLGQDGYSVFPVTDSRIALAEARRLKPAVIILDILMPHKDGWEVLAELKADPELAMVPVVFYTIVEQQQMGLTLGASAYLLKPIDGEELRSTVAKLVTPPATILVVDDDPNALEIMSQQMAHVSSYRVIKAQGGIAGLQSIAESRPDLIILDLMMPEVDGFMLLERLAQDPETSTIPVVVVSAKDLTAQERTFLSRRVQSLLTKGRTTPEQLLGNVAALLRTRGSGSATLAPASADLVQLS